MSVSICFCFSFSTLEHGKCIRFFSFRSSISISRYISICISSKNRWIQMSTSRRRYRNTHTHTCEPFSSYFITAVFVFCFYIFDGILLVLQPRLQFIRIFVALARFPCKKSSFICNEIDRNCIETEEFAMPFSQHATVFK